jgi:hypothetical protein
MFPSFAECKLLIRRMWPTEGGVCSELNSMPSPREFLSLSRSVLPHSCLSALTLLLHEEALFHGSRARTRVDLAPPRLPLLWSPLFEENAEWVILLLLSTAVVASCSICRPGLQLATRLGARGVIRCVAGHDVFPRGCPLSHL